MKTETGDVHMREQNNPNTISWQIQFDNREPRTEMDDLLEKIRYFRWELDVDPEVNYSLEELEEMKAEHDERDAKDLDPEG